MIDIERKITKDIYDRAMEHHRMITDDDMDAVFSAYEQLGAGVYGTYVFMRDGEYFCKASIGRNAD